MQQLILRFIPFPLLAMACLLGGCSLSSEELIKEWPLPREGQWLLVNVRLEAGGYSSVVLVSHDRPADRPTEVWHAQISPSASGVMRLLNAFYGDRQPTVLEFTTLPGTKDQVTGIGVSMTATHPSNCVASHHYGIAQ